MAASNMLNKLCTSFAFAGRSAIILFPVSAVPALLFIHHPLAVVWAADGGSGVAGKYMVCCGFVLAEEVPSLPEGSGMAKRGRRRQPSQLPGSPAINGMDASAALSMAHLSLLRIFLWRDSVLTPPL